MPLDTRYKVFLHLINGNGQLVAQRDSKPGGALNFTTRWPPGETIMTITAFLFRLICRRAATNSASVCTT